MCTIQSYGLRIYWRTHARLSLRITVDGAIPAPELASYDCREIETHSLVNLQRSPDCVIEVMLLLQFQAHIISVHVIIL